MKKTIQPVNGYVLIKPKTPKSGVIVLVSEEAPATEGVVIRSSTHTFKGGDQVVFNNSYNNKIIQSEGEDFLLVKGEDIIAKRCLV